MQIEGILLTVDIEKSFHSVNHLFYVSALERYGFKNNFIRWIKLLLQNQESCIINRGQTTNYFILERGTRQGDPLSAYLFILVLEIVLIELKRNTNIKSLNFYILRTLTIPPFLENEKSATEVLNNFAVMSQLPGLKINK